MKKDNDISQVCAYCEYASPLYDKNQILCAKKGVVDGSFKCRKFVYDPLKHKPIVPKPLD